MKEDLLDILVYLFIAVVLLGLVAVMNSTGSSAGGKKERRVMSLLYILEKALTIELTITAIGLGVLLLLWAITFI